MNRHRNGRGGGTATQERKAEPVHSVRHRTGGGILEGAVWVGEGKDERVVFNITFSRSWCVEGKWNDTKSMRVQDLPALAILANDLYLYCQEEMART